KKLKHDLDVVVDRVVVRADIAQRLAESFETALKLADGIAVVEFADGVPKDSKSPSSPGRRAAARPGDPDASANAALDGRVKPGHEGSMKRGHLDDENRILFSSKFACPVSGFTISEIEPRLFSFNSPHGAC